MLPVVQAYVLLPALIVFAKCVPESCSELMVGLLNSILKFNTEVVMRLMSLLFVYNSDITYEDYDGLASKIYSSVGYSLISLSLVRYLFDRKEYAALQAVVFNIDKMTPQEIKNFNV